MQEDIHFIILVWFKYSNQIILLNAYISHNLIFVLFIYWPYSNLTLIFSLLRPNPKLTLT